MVHLTPATAVVFGLNYVTGATRRLTAERFRKEDAKVALTAESNRKKRDNGVDADRAQDRAELLQTTVRKSGTADTQDNNVKHKRLLERIRTTRVDATLERTALVGYQCLDASKSHRVGKVAPAKECVPANDADAEADADVGTLSSSLRREYSSSFCQTGYVCVPSNDLVSGGRCILDSTFNTSRSLKISGRDTKIGPDYCPKGCPATICECYETNMTPLSDCYSALAASCRDGTYLSSCASSDPDEYAYAAGACDTYVCLDDKGLSIGDGPLCDFTTVDCADCYCSYYRSICDQFGPLCVAGSDASFCDYLDVICTTADCCDSYGAAACIMNSSNTNSTTQSPDNGTEVKKVDKVSNKEMESKAASTNITNTTFQPAVRPEGNTTTPGG